MTPCKGHSWGRAVYIKNFPWECRKGVVKLVVRLFPGSVGGVVKFRWASIEQDVVVSNFVGFHILELLSSIRGNEELFLINRLVCGRVKLVATFHLPCLDEIFYGFFQGSVVVFLRTLLQEQQVGKRIVRLISEAPVALFDIFHKHTDWLLVSVFFLNCLKLILDGIQFLLGKTLARSHDLKGTLHVSLSHRWSIGGRQLGGMSTELDT